MEPSREAGGVGAKIGVNVPADALRPALHRKSWHRSPAFPPCFPAVFVALPDATQSRRAPRARSDARGWMIVARGAARPARAEV